MHESGRKESPARGYLLRKGPGFAVLTAVCAVLVLFTVCAARAVPPKYFEINNARVDMSSGTLVARLSIGVDNITGLFEMLKDGASVELIVTARLERTRTLWTNVTLADKELVSSLQHNPLTREFSLHMPGESQPTLDKNLDRLLAATWEKFSVDLGPLDILDGDADAEYRITLTLVLRHAKAPPWLARNFMVWSRNILDPETVELPFRR